MGSWGDAPVRGLHQSCNLECIEFGNGQHPPGRIDIIPFHRIVWAKTHRTIPNHRQRKSCPRGRNRGTTRVAADGTAVVGGTRYQVPSRYVGARAPTPARRRTRSVTSQIPPEPHGFPLAWTPLAITESSFILIGPELNCLQSSPCTAVDVALFAIPFPLPFLLQGIVFLVDHCRDCLISPGMSIPACVWLRDQTLPETSIPRKI